MRARMSGDVRTGRGTDTDTGMMVQARVSAVCGRQVAATRALTSLRSGPLSAAWMLVAASLLCPHPFPPSFLPVLSGLLSPTSLLSPHCFLSHLIHLHSPCCAFLVPTCQIMEGSGSAYLHVFAFEVGCPGIDHCCLCLSVDAIMGECHFSLCFHPFSILAAYAYIGSRW
jgi:hypothetical protein